MTSTIISILCAYGFAAKADGSASWGFGTLMWGDTVEVRPMGGDRYAVTVRHWFYDQYGDPVRDSRETRTLYGGQALAWAFTELPTDFWRFALRH